MVKTNKRLSLEDRANRVVELALPAFNSAKSWIEFSNFVFSQHGGLIASEFPRMPERKEFYTMTQYSQLNEMLLGVVKRFGADDGTATQKSGKFVVRLPKTVHHALQVEAEVEGVSLNQLAVSKLTPRLAESTNTSQLVEAFRKVHNGWSADRVVVDPELNKKFLAECRKLGMTQSDFEINNLLFRARKSGKASLPPTTQRESLTNYDDFLFAAEIAFRHLQRRDGFTLDRVLCDPAIATQFDAIAKQLSPEQSAFKLRMAALYLRKTHRLKPGDAVTYTSKGITLEYAGKLAQLNLGRLPELPGLYVFCADFRPIYASDTHNLRHRLGRHVAIGGQQFLPSWLGLGFEKNLELKYMPVPKATTRELLILLNGYINKEKPPLNYQNAA